jgi:hypothetical protein
MAINANILWGGPHGAAGRMMTETTALVSCKLSPQEDDLYQDLIDLLEIHRSKLRSDQFLAIMAFAIGRIGTAFTSLREQEVIDLVQKNFIEGLKISTKTTGNA